MTNDHPRCEDQTGSTRPRIWWPDMNSSIRTVLITRQEKYNKVIDAWFEVR